MNLRELEKYYLKTFRTPKKWQLLSLLLLFLLVPFKNIFIVLMTFVFTLSFITVLILLNKARILVGLNSNRVLLVTLILVLTGVVLFLLSNNVMMFFLSPAALAYLLLLTTFFTSEMDYRNVLLFGTVLIFFFLPFTILIMFIFKFSTTQYLFFTHVYICTGFSGLLMGHFYLEYLNKSTNTSIRFRELLRGFILTWFTNIPLYSEKELKKYSTMVKGWIKVIQTNCSSLITTSFHPGPFRNVGGSTLVNSVLSLNNSSMYLHSPTNHTLDPATKDDVSKIVNKIKHMMNSSEFTEIKPFKPFEVCGKKYKLWVFPFDKLLLIIIDGKLAIDDLPPNLTEIAESTFKKDVMLIEGHNAFSANFKFDLEDINEIKDLFKSCLSKITREHVKVKCYFAKEKISSKNICGYIAILFLKYGDDIYALLMIDGNNIDISTKNKLLKKFKDLKLIIVTTDNHSKTGITPRVKYCPINDDDLPKIIGFIRKALKYLKFVDTKLFYLKSDIYVNVLGENFFRQLESIVKSNGFRFFILFIFLLILNPILGYVFSMFFSKIKLLSISSFLI